MKTETDIEYPCGLKYKVRVDTGFWGMGHVSINDTAPICPIHGEKCARAVK